MVRGLLCWKIDHLIFKLDHHRAFNYDEHLIGMSVIMPSKFAFDFHQFELVIIHLSDDFRRPVVGKLREFVAKIDFLHEPQKGISFLIGKAKVCEIDAVSSVPALPEAMTSTETASRVLNRKKPKMNGNVE